MIIVGLVAWLAFMGLYLGVLIVLAIALVRWFYSKGPTVVTRVLTALVFALVGGFAGCTVLFVPFEAGSDVIKPRLIDSLGLADALPFAISLVSGVAFHIYMERRTRRQHPHHSGEHSTA